MIFPPSTGVHVGRSNGVAEIMAMKEIVITSDRSVDVRSRYSVLRRQSALIVPTTEASRGIARSELRAERIAHISSVHACCTRSLFCVPTPTCRTTLGDHIANGAET